MIRYLPLLLLGVFLSSYVSQSYEVQSVCEVTDVYNYIVKWEVAPLMDGEVVIYSSSDPDKFDMRHPVARENISKGRSDIVIKGSLNRRYFLLCFPDDVQTIVGVRCQNFASVENFRDMGGYQNNDRRSMKWGKLYRSGYLDSISAIDAKRIARMKVRTLIDLRHKHLTPTISSYTGIQHYYSLPIRSSRPDPLPLIFCQKFKRGDAILFMQDIYQDMLFVNTDNLRQIFELLQDEENYPLIISCLYGNVQTSMVIALIMAAIDVPEPTIIDDYIMSNKYFDMRSIATVAATLPLESQDAITSMMISDERYLNSAFQLIKRKYGSINEYLEKELGVDEAARNRLKKILLD